MIRSKWTLWLCALVTAAGCTNADAEAKGAYFSCGKPSDCLSGYSCVCGYCVRGTPPADLCPADGMDASDSEDSGASSDTSAKTDAEPGSDVEPTPDGNDASSPCNLISWQGCEPGKGCFYLQGQPTCKTHGNVGYQNSCNPLSTTPQCGKAEVAGQPANLLCDVVDKKCYPTCDCDASQTCTNGMTCYCLTDAGGGNLPGGAGICAP